MRKEKKIKLKVSERKEADRLQREITIAEYGIAISHRLAFEAGERLWKYLRMQYPQISRSSLYRKGILTYKEKKP